MCFEFVPLLPIFPWGGKTVTRVSVSLEIFLSRRCHLHFNSHDGNKQTSYMSTHWLQRKHLAVGSFINTIKGWYNLDLIFEGLAIVAISYDSVVLTKLTAEIWETKCEQRDTDCKETTRLSKVN